MDNKPIFTLTEWHKNIDKKTQTQLFEPQAILRDWGRDELILKAEIDKLNEFVRECKSANNRMCDEVEGFELTIDRLTKLNKILDDWIEVAGGINCPNSTACNNSGGYPSFDGESETQCQFCYECPESVFNRKARQAAKELSDG